MTLICHQSLMVAAITTGDSQFCSRLSTFARQRQPGAYISLHARLGETERYAKCGICSRRADYATPLYPQKLALNFIYKWRSLSRYCSRAD
jgi:hypothetical protein